MFFLGLRMLSGRILTDFGLREKAMISRTGLYGQAHKWFMKEIVFSPEKGAITRFIWYHLQKFQESPETILSNMNLFNFHQADMTKKLLIENGKPANV